MLTTSYLKINIVPDEDDHFFLTAMNEKGEELPPSDWKRLLFSYHEESFYGTFIDETENGVKVNSWELVSLLAKEQFNRLITWDWNEVGQICLAAAYGIYEAIMERNWLIDFPALQEGEFRWQLPHQLIDEFAPSFWEQQVAGTSVRSFIEKLFNWGMDRYFDRNKELKQSIGKKIETFRNTSIPPERLAAYFNEETWAKWLGMKEDATPFTIGLRLVEPGEVYETWDLDVFLRSKENREYIVDRNDEGNMPKAWLDFLEEVDKEEQRWIALFPWLRGKRGLTNTLCEEEAWLFLTEASELLLALGVEILLPSWWQEMKNAQYRVKAKVKGTSNYQPSFVGLNAVLDYDWRISMNGVELSEEEFNRLVEEKRRLVYIQGQWIKLDPGFVRQIKELMKRAEKEGLHVRDLIEQELAEAKVEEDDALEDARKLARIRFELNREFRKMIRRLKDVKSIPLSEVPASFSGELRPYQQLGMSWLLFLREYGFGGILADDMGLGKTVQLLSYLLAVKEKGERGPALIICPTSVLGNWQKEIERFAPSFSVYLHYGANRVKGEAFAEKALDADIVLSSYGLTHIDFEEFSQVEWGTIAIDEAQNIKNPETKQSRAVRKLTGRHHVALSGTPMENRLTELWAIFDFTNKGYLGSLSQFQKRFVVPIEKDEDKGKIAELQNLIRPFLLRRTKKDEEVALNLPNKLEQKEFCSLTEEQAALYEQVVQDTFAQLERLTGFERKGLILQMLGRLKQLCNHPALYLKEEKPANVLKRSFKLEKLVEIVESVLEQEESCLIFTQYIEMGEMIRRLLQERFMVEAPFLNGSVPKGKRDEMIARFQAREFPLFILSLKAGGTGLNLTAANHVIHYDRWWNPAVENQATDRAYRIGQKRFVHVHKFITTGTLEEKIDAMLEKKQSLNDQIIQSDNWITELDTEELHQLIRLG